MRGAVEGTKVRVLSDWKNHADLYVQDGVVPRSCLPWVLTSIEQLSRSMNFLSPTCFMPVTAICTL